MPRFLTEDFLLDTEFSRCLYHDYAKHEPIYDYHCHLPPQQIAEDYRFKNLYDIWLKGDHYKWRAMRTNGVAERFCTGEASDWEKFSAWAATVPHTMGNPLYHWTHLELRRPFGITGTLLSPATATEIWQRSNALLAQDHFSARGIMQQMKVKMVGTTDDPIDDLRHHRMLAEDDTFTIRVLPSWRPDKAFNIEAEGFNDYLQRLSAVADQTISRFSELCAALKKRLNYFADHGCRIADHALDVVLYGEADETTLDAILVRRLNGRLPTQEEKKKKKKFTASVNEKGQDHQYPMGCISLRFFVQQRNHIRLEYKISKDYFNVHRNQSVN